MFLARILSFLLCFTFLSSTKSWADVVFFDLSSLSVEDDNDNKFFLTYKNSLLLNLGTDVARKYEGKVGSFKNELSPRSRDVETGVLADARVVVGDRIDLIDYVSTSVQRFKIAKKSRIKLIPDPYDSDYFFRTFNLVMGDDDFGDFSSVDYLKFDNIALSSSSYKLLSAKMSPLFDKELSKLEEERYELLLKHAENLDPKLKGQKLLLSKASLQDVKVIVVRTKEKGDLFYYLDNGSSDFIGWRATSLGFNEVSLYGKNVFGVDLVAIYSQGNSYYVLLFGSKKILKFPVYDRP